MQKFVFLANHASFRVRQCACDFHHRLPGVLGGFSARTFKPKLKARAPSAQNERDRQTRARPNPPNSPAAPQVRRTSSPENWFSLEPLGPKGRNSKLPGERA